MTMMRDETRKNLNRALFRDRMKKVGIGAAILAAIAAFMLYQSYDLQVTNTNVSGVIESIEPYVGNSTTANATGLTVGVKLDDGRHVHIIEKKEREPKVGERITVVEHHHGTGRVTHSLK